MDDALAARRFRTVGEEKLADLEYQPAQRPFRPTPAEKGSGLSDVSVDHDRYRYLAEEDPKSQK